MLNPQGKERIILFKIVFILSLIILITSEASAQVGVAFMGSFTHPGLSKSEKNDIHFGAGGGYGFSVRHGLFEINENHFDMRYTAILETHHANLQLGEDATYDFSNFSIDLLYFNPIDTENNYYCGLAVNLLSASSDGKFRKTYVDNTFYPSVLVGYSNFWAEGFDFFIEANAAIGGIAATEDGEEIPINGLSLRAGITMYISED